MSDFNKVIERPEIRSIGTYDFPSRSAQVLYGDDQLVHVWYDGNPWFVAAACFRAPRAMSFGDFWSALVVPYHEEDPDWQASWTPADFDEFTIVVPDDPRLPAEIRNTTVTGLYVIKDASRPNVDDFRTYLKNYGDYKETYTGFDVLPGDLVFVPRSKIAEVDLFVQQYIEGVLPFSRGVSYNLNDRKPY